MANDWIEVTVEDIKGDTPNSLATGPFGSAISSRYFVDAGVPVLRGSNLSQDVGTRLIETGLAYVSLEKGKEFSRSIAKKGDLVFTCWGTIDQVGLIDDRCQFPEYVVSNKQMKFTPAPSRADSLFLYYLFSSPQSRGQILSHGIGSSVPGFNLGQLRSMKLKLPPIEEQHAIARVLGSLDDKIELNRKMNETLEAMARALFKSWFVDFDPVRAKAEGRDTGLPAHIAALFPDSFEDSELGEIPTGWSVAVLDQFVEHVLGGDWGGDELTAGKPVRVRCIRGADIPDLQRGGVGKMPSRYIKQSSASKRTLNDGDLVIEISGGSPTQSTGRPVLISSQLLGRLDAPLVCSNFCRMIRLKSQLTSEFIYLWLLTLYANDEFLKFENGTTGIKNFAFTLFSSTYGLVVPPPAAISIFAAQAKPLFLKLHANAAEIETLSRLRDTLLPRLISGEIRLTAPHDMQPLGV